MLRAIWSAMISPEGIIIGTCWVLLVLTIVVSAIAIWDAIDRRRTFRLHGLNMSRRGEVAK